MYDNALHLFTKARQKIILYFVSYCFGTSFRYWFEVSRATPCLYHIKLIEMSII